MMVEKSAEGILSFAAERAQEVWDERRQPYLLARLSPDLEREGIDYKEVLGEQRLKDFVQSAPNRIKVVVHPAQKAKIGLIPHDKNFEFAAESPLSEPKTTFESFPIWKAKSSRRRYIVLNFLQLLSELDNVDAAQVQIPTHILAKLVSDK